MAHNNQHHCTASHHWSRIDTYKAMDMFTKSLMFLYTKNALQEMISLLHPTVQSINSLTAYLSQVYITFRSVLRLSTRLNLMDDGVCVVYTAVGSRFQIVLVATQYYWMIHKRYDQQDQNALVILNLWYMYYLYSYMRTLLLNAGISGRDT